MRAFTRAIAHMLAAALQRMTTPLRNAWLASFRNLPAIS